MDDLVQECLDMDGWKHSWYNNFKTIEDYEKCKKVIDVKIRQRIDELTVLVSGQDRIEELIKEKTSRMKMLEDKE